MIRVKICGVTTVADAEVVADAGADAIGLNFYTKSPRYVEPRQALTLIRAMGPFLAPVGVFVDTPLRQSAAIAFQLGLRGIQSYDATPPSEDPSPFAYIPAFRVKTAESLQAVQAFVQTLKSAGRPPSAVLIDSYVEGQMGGTGHRAPWELLRDFDAGVPLILAGGLTPDNVADAIRTVRPWGVDVASGVEISPGRKDAGKIRAFVTHARAAAANRD